MDDTQQSQPSSLSTIADKVKAAVMVPGMAVKNLIDQARALATPFTSEVQGLSAQQQNLDEYGRSVPVVPRPSGTPLLPAGGQQ